MTTFTSEQEQYWNEGRHSKRRHPSHPVIEAYVAPKLAFVKRVTGLPRGTTVLDVGAGNGYFSYYWEQEGPVTAIDYSEVMLQENPVRDKRVMDARALTFPDNAFDVVFCHAVLHHIENIDRLTVVREMRRVARAHVVIIEPNRRNPLMAAFGLLKKEEHGILAFSPRTLTTLAQNAGLRVLSAKPFGFLMPNRMPFARQLLPLLRHLERPFPLGMNTILIGAK